MIIRPIAIGIFTELTLIWSNATDACGKNTPIAIPSNMAIKIQMVRFLSKNDIFEAAMVLLNI